MPALGMLFGIGSRPPSPLERVAYKTLFSRAETHFCYCSHVRRVPSRALSCNDKLIHLVRWYSDFDTTALRTAAGTRFLAHGSRTKFHPASGIWSIYNGGHPSLHGISRVRSFWAGGDWTILHTRAWWWLWDQTNVWDAIPWIILSKIAPNLIESHVLVALCHSHWQHLGSQQAESQPRSQWQRQAERPYHTFSDEIARKGSSMVWILNLCFSFNF